MLHARRFVVFAAIVATIFVGCAKRPALTAVSAPAPTGGAEVAAAPAAPAPAPGRRRPRSRPGPRARTGDRGPRARRVRPRRTSPPWRRCSRSTSISTATRSGPNDRRILDANAAWLKQNTNQLVLIEGHCDERGTNEYNLGLGERRARATMNYLVAQGIQASRITVVSYGEERPVCTEKNESCWAKNRRAAFLAKEQ